VTTQGDGAVAIGPPNLFSATLWSYLTYWGTRPDYQVVFSRRYDFGKDGRLRKIRQNSPGAASLRETGTVGS